MADHPEYEDDEDTQVLYCNRGPRSGDCGHAHRTIRTAVRCRLKSCALGICDRVLCHADGSPISDGEWHAAGVCAVMLEQMERAA